MATEKLNPDKFCEEIDKIESVIRGLTSKDENEAREATERADELIALNEKSNRPQKYEARDNTGVNRTVINQKAFDELGGTQPNGPSMTTPGMDQAGFMAAMEQDAKERSERKAEAQKEAMTWKEKGNEEFKNGNFEKAVEHYSTALTHFKDTTVLWTNRAQAYIKLRQYEKALTDCDWATRVFQNCLKAYIHQGRAYLGLKQFEKAIESYERAKQIEPKKENIIDEYIKAVEHAEQTHIQEESAKEFKEKGGWQSEGFVGTFEKLNKTDQLPFFYSGGLMVLANMKDNDERTLFRTQGGLKIIEEHPVISRYFNASPRSLSRDELDVCAATFCVLTAACVNNEENKKQLLDTQDFSTKVIKFMETCVKNTKYLKECAVSLLLQMSESEIGRTKIIDTFDMKRLVPDLFKLMMLRGQVGVSSVSLLNNLALHKRFKKLIREDINDILMAFEKLMVEGPKNPKVLPTCVCTVTNLCSDDVLRKIISKRMETWQACLKVMTNHLPNHADSVSSDVLHSVLGLLSNLTYDSSIHETSLQIPISLCDHCYQLLNDSNEVRLQERCMSVLGHVMPNSDDAVNFICKQGGVLKFLKILKAGCPEHIKGAIKCLTVCTNQKQTAREQVNKFKSGPQLLHKLLKHNDDVVIGNAALCLDNCCQIPGFASSLTDTNIMMDLLVLARDGNRVGVQKNCAILIAKLCKGDNKHLEKLRELDGLGILHNLMGKVID